MKNALPVAIAALLIAGISIWLNVDWKKTYQDCDRQKQDCYKACRATWDAEREKTNSELAEIDSIENSYNQDSTSIVPDYVRRWHTRVSDQRVDNLIKYLKCKEDCENAWERCTGEE